ncbi:MAG: putative DNA binding domain-containing protein [Anaerolineales bacterium]|jgi:ATP-dependent DNA helicase RecG
MAEEQPAYENVLALLAHGMGPDLHWYPESVSLSDLAETLAAMANSRGGKVILGVAPRTGNLQGVSDVEQAADLVFQAALLSEPVLVLPIPAVQQVTGKQVVIVTVPEGLPNVYNLEGRYLTRDGRHNIPFSARKLRELLVARGILQFESRVPPDASLNDLDQTQIEAYLQVLNRSQEDWQQVLLTRGCLAKEGDTLRPTYAALLLFGKHPSAGCRTPPSWRRASRGSRSPTSSCARILPGASPSSCARRKPSCRITCATWCGWSD